METITKLDPEFKVELLTALRSGEYRQGKVFLYNRHHDTYCVMGVAGIILGLDKETISGRCSYSEALGYPKEMSIEETLMDVPMSMNDDGKSFEEIADYIEKNL